ncbi:MAG: TauD/TfdA family dioxygenase, partial [Proteobacteria bacterium]|nr:TauD/TfdA family dioxygenase [Pseudomonadota bacterium]
LPAGEKARIETWRVLNVYDYGGNPTVRGYHVNPDAPRFVHPLVIVHPVTGERLLFANRLMSVRIEGLDRDESDRVLTRLFDHAEQSRFIFEHAWKAGDLVMWDNLAVMHARTDFDPAEGRVLRRVAVKGPRPLGVDGRG